MALEILRTTSKRFARLAGEAGASLVEYTLLVALIAAVAIGAVTFLGTTAKNSLCETGQAIAGTTECATPTTTVTP